MTLYTDAIERCRQRNPGKEIREPAGKQFIPYYGTGQRIRVRTTYPGGEIFERTGTVSLSMGWWPTFLLMHRSNAIGSCDTLGAKDEIVAVQYGRKYVPIEALPVERKVGELFATGVCADCNGRFDSSCWSCANLKTQSEAAQAHAEAAMIENWKQRLPLVRMDGTRHAIVRLRDGEERRLRIMHAFAGDGRYVDEERGDVYWQAIDLEDDEPAAGHVWPPQRATTARPQQWDAGWDAEEESC